MGRNLRIEGYAIASADGMIADATGYMPDSLKFEADQRFFLDSLDRVQVVCHGRLSHEGDPESHNRRRLILTRRVHGLAPDPDNPNTWLWNPAGATLDEACAAVGCGDGTLAIAGGTDVYSMFLTIGYDVFAAAAPFRRWPSGGSDWIPSPRPYLSIGSRPETGADRISRLRWNPLRAFGHRCAYG